MSLFKLSALDRLDRLDRWQVNLHMPLSFFFSSLLRWEGSFEAFLEYANVVLLPQIIAPISPFL